MSADLGRGLKPPRADPSSVRWRGDRGRLQLGVAAVLATVVVLVGTAGSVSYLAGTGRGGSPPGSTVAPTTSVTDRKIAPSYEPSAAPTDPAVPTDRPTAAPPDPQTATGVPDSAMLPDLRGAEAYQRALEYKTYLSPPRPCVGNNYPSNAGLLRSRPAHGMLPGNGESPEVVIEYVARYRAGSGAAAQYLDELRADVQRCPGRMASGIDRGDHTWSVAGSGFAGDESLLVRLRGDGRGYQPPPECCTDLYVAVVRAGEVLVVVSSLGWEGGGSDPQFAKQTAATALTHARTLG